MIARNEEKSTTRPAHRLSVLAAGSITHDEASLAAPSLFCSTDVIEHRIARQTFDRWVAEVRLNGQVLDRAFFYGERGNSSAAVWCRAMAPHATRARYSPCVPAVNYDGEVDDLIEGRLDDEWHARGLW